MVNFTRAAAAALLACAVALPATALPAQAAAPASAAAPATARLTTVTPAVPAPPLELPAPTGRFGVGSSLLHLVDRSRPDPWVPTADGRELMVTVHYPAARRAPHGATAPYATAQEARLLLEGVGVTDPAAPKALAGMNTYSVKGARPAAGKHPLVLLSPGFGVPRFTLTHLAVDLASRGYVVASVDHAYEANGTEMPGGRILPCVACEKFEDGSATGKDVTAARTADVRFVIDRLTKAGPHAAWPYARTIDARRIGMAGHSIGGASAAAAMVADRRIDAGVNMDGSFWDTLPAGGLGGRPFLMLGTDDETHRPGGLDATWDTTWKALGGWKRWLTVAGSDHFTFSDAPVLLRHFGLPTADIPSDRALSVTRSYLAAFFDAQLRGRHQPLLDGPSPAHPEVKFHNP
ncbi:alpha/beta hydrolase family protein [Streptomyces sp. NPDC090025]|uniref:alpha/beta hydrolase family protein n=1 Tax=Streptomyces sp. NPDC090025 TaxID=3365922 RepID=UPI0038384145